MIDPTSIPRIEGDMDALAVHARAISAFGVAFAEIGERIHATWQQLAAFYHAPEMDQLLAAMLPVKHVSAAVGEDNQTVGRALLTYADTVRPIQQRLEQLRAQSVALVAAGTVLPGEGAPDQAVADEKERRLGGAVDAAVAEFQTAERACANAINALYGGTRYRAHDGDGRAEPGEYGSSAQQLAAGMGAQPGQPWGEPFGTDPGVLAFLLAGIRQMLAGTSILPSPPAGGSPEQNAAWWASLSPGARQALVVTSPGLVGNLNGLPAWARDQANRGRLRGAASRLDAEIARLRADLPPRGGPGYDVTHHEELRRLEQLEAKRASLKEIGDTLELGGRQLLVLDLSGDRAEAAVAIGDVDTAEHVAVFTPGLFGKVDEGGLERYDEQMAQLQQQAQQRAASSPGEGTVATVTWIGYQAPQQYGDSGLVGQAEAGADKLAEFNRGINASRDDPHLTTIGHSYGSTTTGLAVQQPDTGVDDVVVMGSPGMGTSDVEDLNVQAGHTYAVEARGDYVADFGRFGADPNQMEGVTGLSAREETVDGRELNETSGHDTQSKDDPGNGYLAQDTSSQYNISTVVAGVPEQAVHDDGRGFGDWLRSVRWLWVR